MKALVKSGLTPDGVNLIEIDKPVPKSGELLVKIMAAGICGTDIHIMHDEYKSFMPVVMGHEFTGIVEGIGDDVNRFCEGDQIIASTAAKTCEHCEYCREGLRMLCENRRSIGSGINGAMAEYMLIPEKLAYKVPDKYNGSKIIAIAEPIACVVRAVIEQSLFHAGDVVLVSGPGTIGLLTLQILKYAGAFVIVNGTSIDEERLSLAKDLGADVVCCDSISLKKALNKYASSGVDVAYECAGHVNSLSVCIDSLKKRGNLAQVGLYGKPITLDFDKILYKEIKVTVSFASEPSSWNLLIKILTHSELRLEPLISNAYKLENWREAFDKFEKKEGLKILLVP